MKDAHRSKTKDASLSEPKKDLVGTQMTIGHEKDCRPSLMLLAMVEVQIDVRVWDIRDGMGRCIKTYTKRLGSRIEPLESAHGQAMISADL